MSRLQDWLRKRAEARWQRQRERGFVFVMVSYHLHKQPVDEIIHTAFQGTWDSPEDGFDQGVSEALDLLPQPPEARAEALLSEAQPVAVKALEWQASQLRENTWLAPSGFGEAYVAARHEGQWRCIGQDWPSLDAAKAAAQADFEVRIRSALAAPVSKGVAISEAMVEAARKAADDALWKWRGLGERKDGEGLDGMHFIVRAALTAASAASDGGGT